MYKYITGASSSGGKGFTAVSFVTWILIPTTAVFTCGSAAPRDRRSSHVLRVTLVRSCLGL